MSEISRSDVEAVFSRLEVHSRFRNAAHDTSDSLIADARRTLDEALRAGVEVSDFQAQMPELERNILSRNAFRAFTKLQTSPNPHYDIRVARIAIQKAKAGGVDVSAIEEKMPIFEQVAIRDHLWCCVKHFTANPPTSLNNTAIAAIATTREVMKIASEAGVDVSFAEDSLLEREMEARRNFAETMVAAFKEFMGGELSIYSTYHHIIGEVRKALEAASNIGVDVSDLQAEILEVEENNRWLCE